MKIKSFLYKKKKTLYNIPKKILKNVFWETNPDNLYYGHYQILKSYSKTTLPYKINGEVQHGWSPDHGIAANPFLHDKNKKKERYYLFNEKNKNKSLEYGYSNTFLIGAPFIYLPNIHINSEETSKKSIIFFPLHTHEYDLNGDPFHAYCNYLEELKKITKFFNFVTVCLGWREYINKRIINLFKDQSIKVVTMGERDNNPGFLYKFKNIVRHHEYLSSDSFSSAVFYGLFMGKKVFLHGTNMGKGEKENWEGKLKNYNEFYHKLYPELHWENFNHKSYSEIGKNELGLDNKLTPGNLREVFGWRIKNIF